MKRNTKWFLGVAALPLTIVMAFISCSSAPAVYDASVPLEKSSTLIIIQCQVGYFDGKKTDGKWNASMGTKKVVIPMGDHTLKMYNAQQSGSYLETGNIEINYDFLPGHTYIVIAPIVNRTIVGRIMEEIIIPDTSNTNATPFEGKWENTKDERQQFIFAGNEFMSFFQGTVSSRGSFSYKDNKLSVDIWAFFSLKKWRVVNQDLIDLGATKFSLTHNGTLLIDAKGNELRKIE
jgi:hypothetical protein